jgi:hypothetical protein
MSYRVMVFVLVFLWCRIDSAAAADEKGVLKELSVTHPGWSLSGHFYATPPPHTKLILGGNFYSLPFRKLPKDLNGTQFWRSAPSHTPVTLDEILNGGGSHEHVSVDEFVHGNATRLDGWAYRY